MRRHRLATNRPLRAGTLLAAAALSLAGAGLARGAFESADATSGPDRLSPSRPWVEGGSRGSARAEADPLAWTAERPLELGVRVPIERGLAVGAVAEVSPRRAALDAFLDVDLEWNASATAELDLDRRGGWKLVAGAGARSVPTAPFEPPSSSNAGDAEGVVWLRFGASF